jgi:demethylmenaquinone methyltransferase/2-methoxy-6-polyprenyl-1,4-benzoquinol methylase
VDWDSLLEEGTLLSLVAEERVVGVAAARHLEDAAEVVALYVAPPWRRRYWGSELLVELLERLQGAGLSAAATVVPTAQESLIGFWSSRGWGSLLKVFAHPLEEGAAPDWDRVWQQLRGGAARLGTPLARVTRSKEEAREAYDRLSRWYDLLAEGSEGPFREQGLALLDVQTGERVLEVGSGTGHALAALAQAVGEEGRVYGLDISPKMHARARERLREAGLGERVALRLGDGARLPFEDESADALFMGFTLELFDTPQIPHVLAECRRVLRPEGRLCVVSLARRDGGPVVEIYEWVHRTFPKYVDCRPIHPARALEGAGFEVVEVERGSTWGLPVDVVLARPDVE